jgi:TPR repeat protein
MNVGVAAVSTMNEKNNFALVPRAPGALEKAEPGARRILSGMVSDTLALARRELGTSPTKPASPLNLSGDAERLYQLGLRCQEIGEYLQAFQWFRVAAEKGLADAQFSLGQCYDYGQGVAREGAEAVRWYRKAAEQGHARGQDCVGTYLYVGRGVEKDYVEAVKWLRKTAESAYECNLLWLGECYAEGKGIAQDYCEAYKFYKLVSQMKWILEDPTTGVQQSLNSLVRRMTSVEIAEGERRYREFKTKYRDPRRT